MTEDPIKTRFEEYKKFKQRVNLQSVKAVAIFCEQWQETTGRILLKYGKKDLALEKLEDAKNRRAEFPKIAEMAKRREK